MVNIQNQRKQRLDALANYGILDTARESAFDELARLAADVCKVPIAVVNFIGDDRQFFKAEVGLGVRQTPLETSFCVHALLEQELLVVPDTAADPRFAANPLVSGAVPLRFYAGAVLKTDEGIAMGTLCVLDTRPRELDELQLRTLTVLGHQVMNLLNLRLALKREVQARSHYQTLFDSMEEGFCIIEFLDGPQGPMSDYVHVEANAAYAKNAGIPDVVGRRVRDMVGDEADDWVDKYSTVLRTGVPIRFERETGGYRHASCRCPPFALSLKACGGWPCCFRTCRRDAVQSSHSCGSTKRWEARVAEALAGRRVLADIVEGTDCVRSSGRS